MSKNNFIYIIILFKVKLSCTILPPSVSAPALSNLLKNYIYVLSALSHLSISHQPIPIWHLSHYPLKDFCQGHQHSPGNKSYRRSSALISPTSWKYQTELLILHNLRHCLLNSMISLFPVFLIPSPAIISQFLICKTSKHCCH